eukprot:scaffold218643_cov49-Attheya_sp.AAC.1
MSHGYRTFGCFGPGMGYDERSGVICIDQVGVDQGIDTEVEIVKSAVMRENSCSDFDDNDMVVLTLKKIKTS